MLRNNDLKNLLDRQFVLTYLTSLTKQDVENMTPSELNEWSNRLEDIKRREAEAVKQT